MEERLIDLSVTLEQAIANMAPAAWDALVLTARVNAILVIAFAVVSFVVASLMVRKWPVIWDKAERADAEVLAGIAAVIVGVGVFVVSFALFSASTWIGLINPEAQAVIDLLDAVKGE